MAKISFGMDWIDGFRFCIELLFVVMAVLGFFMLGMMFMIIEGVIKW